jgi:InsA C-terminal domain
MNLLSEKVYFSGLTSLWPEITRIPNIPPDRGRTFLLDYSYPGQSQHIKDQMVDMAMNASGIRDTARVLHVSPTTVIKELKKRSLTCSK